MSGFDPKQKSVDYRASEFLTPTSTELVRSIQALRCLTEASALHTLIRQRLPTPSCGGHSPYREENSEPGRYVTESLTTNPRVRELPGPQAVIGESIRPASTLCGHWSAEAGSPGRFKGGLLSAVLTLNVQEHRIRLHGIGLPKCRKSCHVDGRPRMCGKDDAKAPAVRIGVKVVRRSRCIIFYLSEIAMRRASPGDQSGVL